MTSRHQATLFLDCLAVEVIRREFNPAQAALIDAHVTLCREDEVADWGEFSKRCHELRPFELKLEFGPPVRENDLVYLPCVGGVAEFDRLRRRLLGLQARDHSAHITLIHPRNGTCDDVTFEKISSRLVPFAHRFSNVSLIRQENGGVWKTLETIEFNS